MKKLNASDFIVTNPIRLNEIPTQLEPGKSRNEEKKALKKIGKKLAKLQDTMYAHNRYGVLVCLQGMDTSGKDKMVQYDNITEPVPNASVLKNIDIYKEKLSKM